MDRIDQIGLDIAAYMYVNSKHHPKSIDEMNTFLENNPQTKEALLFLWNRYNPKDMLELWDFCSEDEKQHIQPLLDIHNKHYDRFLIDLFGEVPE